LAASSKKRGISEDFSGSDDGHLVKWDTMGLGDGTDIFPVADQHGDAQALIVEHPGCPDDPGILSVGKDDPLGMPAKLGVDVLKKRHCAKGGKDPSRRQGGSGNVSEEPGSAVV